ncbi:MAG: OsmC family protein [Trueperaceae bacterium]|nr:OsmC family protein [Trueperaceae bacterium]
MSGPRGLRSAMGASGYRTTVRIGAHLVVADEPVAAGGTDTGPTPMELLGGALAGCISITLRMVAERKGWPLEGVEAEVAMRKEPVEGARPRDAFDVRVTLLGPLDDAMRAELTRVASRCPVHRALAHETPVTTTVA